MAKNDFRLKSKIAFTILSFVMSQVNEFGQIVGEAVPDWKPALFPSTNENLIGKNIILEIVDVEKHARDLFEALRYDSNGESWTYLPYGPFYKDEDFEAFKFGLNHICSLPDTVGFVIINRKDEAQRPLGVCTYLAICEEHGSIEVGHLHYSKLLKQTTATTEAMYLMMK